jgi:hypothetical protein
MARQPDATWSGLPLFRCRWCAFERVNDRDAIDAHERELHRAEVLDALVAIPPVHEPTVMVTQEMQAAERAERVRRRAEAAAAAQANPDEARDEHADDDEV